MGCKDIGTRKYEFVANPLLLLYINEYLILLLSCLTFVKMFFSKFHKTNTEHPGLTRVSSIRFLLFEIKRVLVYSTILYFTDLFNLYIFIQHALLTKKYKTKKAYFLQIFTNLQNLGQIVIESHSFLEY